MRVSRSVWIACGVIEGERNGEDDVTGDATKVVDDRWDSRRGIVDFRMCVIVNQSKSTRIGAHIRKLGI